MCYRTSSQLTGLAMILVFGRGCDDLVSTLEGAFSVPADSDGGTFSFPGGKFFMGLSVALDFLGAAGSFLARGFFPPVFSGGLSAFISSTAAGRFSGLGGGAAGSLEGTLGTGSDSTTRSTPSFISDIKIITHQKTGHETLPEQKEAPAYLVRSSFWKAILIFFIK